MITIEQLEQHKQIEIKLSKVCWEWAKQNLDISWQHYKGWTFNNNGYISINYSYNDIVNNIEYETCYGTKSVSWEELIEFSKTLKL